MVGKVMGETIKIEMPSALEPVLKAMAPGQTVTLTRDGVPVAEVRNVKAARKPRNVRKALEELRLLKASLPPTKPDDQAAIDSWRHGSDL
jgi:antitoxin (DNA-binding transcriptional repressor) of toxin-antitoxin stability system